MRPQLIRLHDRLYIRGHTKSILPSVMLDMLRERDIHFILNVAIIPDYDLEEAARNIGMIYKHEPLSDSQMKRVPTDLIMYLAREVRDAMKNSGVMIHCDSGKNRSLLIAIPALAMFTGKPTSDLISSAREVRPQVLSNKTFEKFLSEMKFASVSKTIYNCGCGLDEKCEH